MNRRNRFLTALAVATLTFGSLFAITGPPQAFAHPRGGHFDRQRCEGHHGERHHNRADQNEKSTSDQPEAAQNE